MAGITYQNFDLTIQPIGNNNYRAHATSPEGAQPTCDFALQFSPDELAALREIVAGPVRDVEVSPIERQRKEGEWGQKVKTFGERLYKTVFAEQVGSNLEQSLNRAREKGTGLRLRLHLNQVPDLADLPWEYLYHSARQLYPALWVQTPIVRFPDLPFPQPALLVDPPPLNILVMISDPEKYTRLDVEREWATIHAAFEGFIETKLVSLDRFPNKKLPRATIDSLQDQLRERDYHVFHFIGHGGFHAATNEAALVMEDSNGQGDLVGAEQLFVTLYNEPTLRLVILNSCEGTRSGPSDPFSGVAQVLVQKGIPAVIAMQFKITDDAAKLFARKFYSAMADGSPIDGSLSQARAGIFANRNPTEWGTPVLFMRSEDGRIFDVRRPTDEQLRQAQIDSLAKDAQAAIERKEYTKAIEKLQKVLELQK